jgi:hypothetical protein
MKVAMIKWPRKNRKIWMRKLKLFHKWVSQLQSNMEVEVELECSF